MPTEIMRRIKIENFKSLGKFWNEKGSGLDLENFVSLLSRYTKHEPEERILIMNGAI